MCNCQTMCRVPDVETENGRWPMPLHAPNCEDFKTEQYVRVGFDGSWCIMTADDEADYRKDVNLYGDPDEYKYEYIYLTNDQFNSLPEFAGF